MVRLTRLAAFPILLLLCYGFASAQPPGAPFQWNEYTGTDGKKYLYPAWVEPQAGMVNFAASGGTLSVAPKTEVTAAKMKLEVPNAGGWATAFENPKATFGQNIMNFVQLGAFDPTNPKVLLPKGSNVRITWTVDLKDGTGKVTPTTYGPYELKAQNTPK